MWAQLMEQDRMRMLEREQREQEQKRSVPRQSPGRAG